MAIQPKPTKRFTESVTASRADCIYLVRGHDSTGKPAWYYLQVEKPKKIIFEKNAKAGQVQLLDYGKILYSAYGENPPEDIKKIMKDEYGFEE